MILSKKHPLHKNNIYFLVVAGVEKWLHGMITKIMFAGQIQKLEKTLKKSKKELK